jgi:hypothetical protein
VHRRNAIAAKTSGGTFEQPIGRMADQSGFQP